MKLKINFNDKIVDKAAAAAVVFHPRRWSVDYQILLFTSFLKFCALDSYFHCVFRFHGERLGHKLSFYKLCPSVGRISTAHLNCISLHASHKK